MKDGGPAFPMPAGPEPRVNSTTHYNEGMSLRDWFAGQLAAAMYTAQHSPTSIPGRKARAEEAYAMADALLEAGGHK